jgi:hypothetical protein
MLPLPAAFAELTEANEIGVQDRHVAPVDGYGLLGDEDAVRIVRELLAVAANLESIL